MAGAAAARINALSNELGGDVCPTGRSVSTVSVLIGRHECGVPTRACKCAYAPQGRPFTIDAAAFASSLPEPPKGQHTLVSCVLGRVGGPSRWRGCCESTPNCIVGMCRTARRTFAADIKGSVVWRRLDGAGQQRRGGPRILFRVFAFELKLELARRPGRAGVGGVRPVVGERRWCARARKRAKNSPAMAFRQVHWSL
jgi:hypothetical protein